MSYEDTPPAPANVYHDPNDVRAELIAGETYTIDTSQPMSFDGHNRIVAEVNAGLDGMPSFNDGFTVVDLRFTPKGTIKEYGGALFDPTIDFLLVGKNFNAEEKTGYKGIRSGETINVGRGDPKTSERFNLSLGISSSQFTIGEKEGELFIRDEVSENGTRVVTAAEMTSDKQPDSIDETTRKRPGAEAEPGPREVVSGEIGKQALAASEVEEPAEQPERPTRGLFGADPMAEAWEAERLAAPARAAAAEAVARRRVETAEMNVQSIFQSPESLRASVADPNLDPGLRQQIRDVVGAWANLRASRAIVELKAGTIGANKGEFLQDLVDQRLTEVRHLNSELEGIMTDVNAFHLASHDNENIRKDQMTAITHQRDMTPERYTKLKDEVQGFNPPAMVYEVARQLGFSTDEVDARIDKIAVRGFEKLSDSELFDFLEEIGDFGQIERGQDIAQTAQVIKDMLPQDWSKDRSTLIAAAEIAGLGPEKQDLLLKQKLASMRSAHSALVRCAEALGHRDLNDDDYREIDNATSAFMDIGGELRAQLAVPRRLLELTKSSNQG